MKPSDNLWISLKCLRAFENLNLRAIFCINLHITQLQIIKRPDY